MATKKLSLAEQLKKNVATNNAIHKDANQETMLDLGKRLLSISLTKIKVNPNQPRIEFDTDEIQKLADSIKDNGLLQPIVVREISDNEYEIISGERRFRAMEQLGREKIDAIVLDKSEQFSAVAALAENIARQNLSDYEVFLAIKAIEHNYPKVVELARAVGLDRKEIYRYRAYDVLTENLNEKIANQPTLLGRSAMNDIKKIKDGLQLSESQFESLFSEAWDLLQIGKLQQTKIANFIKTKALKTDIKLPIQEKKLLNHTGKTAGKIKHTNKNIVIEIKNEYISEEMQKEIENYFNKLLSQ